MAFLDVMNDLFLTQYVSQHRKGQSILDLVICNVSDRICSIEAMKPLGTSDHSTISFDVFCQIKSRILGKPTLKRCDQI